jgi:dissimilatory sulfite reductase related protein
MPVVKFKGKIFNTDEDGFMVDFNDWNETWVQYVKSNEGIADLTEDHWKVVHFLQNYYKEHGNTPRISLLSRETGFRLKQIYHLFPSGPGRGACRIAGLPKPTGCI